MAITKKLVYFFLFEAFSSSLTTFFPQKIVVKTIFLFGIGFNPPPPPVHYLLSHLICWCHPLVPTACTGRETSHAIKHFICQEACCSGDVHALHHVKTQQSHGNCLNSNSHWSLALNGNGVCSQQPDPSTFVREGMDGDTKGSIFYRYNI